MLIDGGNSPALALKCEQGSGSNGDTVIMIPHNLYCLIIIKEEAE